MSFLSRVAAEREIADRAHASRPNRSFTRAFSTDFIAAKKHKRTQSTLFDFNTGVESLHLANQQVPFPLTLAFSQRERESLRPSAENPQASELRKRTMFSLLLRQGGGRGGRASN